MAQCPPKYATDHTRSKLVIAKSDQNICPKPHANKINSFVWPCTGPPGIPHFAHAVQTWNAIHAVTSAQVSACLMCHVYFWMAESHLRQNEVIWISWNLQPQRKRCHSRGILQTESQGEVEEASLVDSGDSPRSWLLIRRWIGCLCFNVRSEVKHLLNCWR